VQVATFVEKKGHATTVKAFIKAQARCPEMTLTLVGKDPEGIRGCIEAMIKDAHLDVRIRIIDWIDFTGLHEFLRGFDVFVHPSRYAENGDCEGGAPIVLLDAQATGMPVVSTTHCDIPSEVVHGSTGLLAGEDDVDSLAEAMEKFCLMGNDEYQGYSARARRHVEDNFDDARCAERLREIYGRLAGSWEKSQG
jgi:colanic acid/amylovoran biosynthesis glycosyltransferase